MIDRSRVGWEQILAPLELRETKVIIQGLARQFGQLKPNGSSGLPLPDSRPVNGIAVGGHVIDAQGDEVAALAVDGQIEHR
jgi:hypothetical protein